MFFKKDEEKNAKERDGGTQGVKKLVVYTVSVEVQGKAFGLWIKESKTQR